LREITDKWLGFLASGQPGEVEGRGPTGATAKLGIPRQTLESKIRKLGINRYLFKTS
jgi:hypothetical protein